MRERATEDDRDCDDDEMKRNGRGDEGMVKRK